MSEDKIIAKLSEHSVILDKHGKKLDLHTEILTEHGKKLDLHTEILTEHGKKLDELSRNESKIITKLIEHDDKLDELSNKIDNCVSRSEYLDGQDKIMKILTKLDDERIFTEKWFKDTDAKVEKNTEEIKTIKFKLKIA